MKSVISRRESWQVRRNPTKKFANPPILPILAKMQTNGFAEETLKSSARRLKHLDKHCDLNNPESTVSFIMTKKNMNTGKPVSEAWKNNLLNAYQHFLNFYEIHYDIKFLDLPKKHIRIPTTEELKLLIASARYPLSLKLSLSMETGLRPIELVRLLVKNVDIENRLVFPSTAKHGSARTLKISKELTHQLETWITRKNLQLNDSLFNTTSQAYRNSYTSSRNYTAKKLQKPRLRTIRLYDFRHYFATMLYYKTQDILYVNQQMGHRRLETTLTYTQLIQFDQEENYICKVAKNLNEAKQLIENGFEYITEMDGLKLFRKRK